MLYDSKELVMENNPSLEHIKERDYDMVSAQFFLPNSGTSQDLQDIFSFFIGKVTEIKEISRKFADKFLHQSKQVQLQWTPSI